MLHSTIWSPPTDARRVRPVRGDVSAGAAADFSGAFAAGSRVCGEATLMPAQFAPTPRRYMSGYSPRHPLRLPIMPSASSDLPVDIIAAMRNFLGWPGAPRVQLPAGFGHHSLYLRPAEASGRGACLGGALASAGRM
jgi:hypothetical protein